MKTRSLTELSFLDDLWTSIVKQQSSISDPLAKLLIFDEINLSHDEESHQGAEAVIATHLARELAFHLIDEKGSFLEGVRLKALSLLSDNLFGYGKNTFHFSRKHLQLMLTALEEEKMKKELMRLKGPFPSSAEIIIRSTLKMEPKERVTDAAARRALLSALFTPLRQRIGSCFATAPAIFVQQEEHERLVAELGELLGMGILRRVVGGVEYGIPLSESSGRGELDTPFFLWERDLSSLAASSGLKEALLSAKVISSTTQEEILPLLQPLVSDISKNPFLVWTPSGLLERLLQHYFQVTDGEIEEAREKRERLKIAPPWRMAGPHKQSKGDSFLVAMEAASSAYIAMSENHLLRSWEYTIASFAESKGEFATWNLFHSLGLNPDITEGLGAFLRECLQEHVSHLQAEIDRVDSDYERLQLEMISLEKGQVTDSYFQAAYFAKRVEMSRIASLREEMYDKGRHISAFFSFLIPFFIEKLKEYFQEIYDPSLQVSSTSLYDDKPAGFRLFYKHGRMRPNLWTPITSPSLYQDSLASFFVAIESEIMRSKEGSPISDVVSDLMTRLLSFVKGERFLSTSFERLYLSYHEALPPHFLQNYKNLKRTPWSYISGGNLETFLSSYFPRGSDFKKVESSIESPFELLSFYIDVAKDLPLSRWLDFSKHQEHSLFAFSPTHAFLFKPGWLKEAVDSELFTHSWIRDNLVKKQEAFLFSILLNREQVFFLLDMIERTLIPHGYRQLFRRSLRHISYPLTPMDFREEVLKNISYEWWMKGSSERSRFAGSIDALLYQSLPLLRMEEAGEKLPVIIDEAQEIDPYLKEKMRRLIAEHLNQFQGKELVTRNQLIGYLEGLIVGAQGKTKSAINYGESLFSAMQRLSLAYPPPLLVADSNWNDVFFGFSVNPGTAKLELMGFTSDRREGFALVEWQPFLNGTKKGNWGIFKY